MAVCINLIYRSLPWLKRIFGNCVQKLRRKVDVPALRNSFESWQAINVECIWSLNFSLCEWVGLRVKDFPDKSFPW